LKTNFDRYLEKNLEDPEFAARFRSIMERPYIQQRDNCSCCQLVAAINAYAYFTGELPFQPFDQNGEYSDEFNKWAEIVLCKNGAALKMSRFYKEIGLETETRRELVSVVDIANIITQHKLVQIGVTGLFDWAYHAVLIIGMSDSGFRIINWSKDELISHVSYQDVENYMLPYGNPNRWMTIFSMPGR